MRKGRAMGSGKLGEKLMKVPGEIDWGGGYGCLDGSVAY